MKELRFFLGEHVQDAYLPPSTFADDTIIGIDYAFIVPWRAVIGRVSSMSIFQEKAVAWFEIFDPQGMHLYSIAHKFGKYLGLSAKIEQPHFLDVGFRIKARIEGVAGSPTLALSLYG